MDANEVLTKAWAAVQASGVPEGLQEVAFKEAIALLKPNTPARRASTHKSFDTTDEVETSGEGASDGIEVDTDVLMQKFADESGIDASELIEVFYFDPDGTPHLNVAGRKLGESTAAKAKAVATAIAAAYHFSVDDPQVPVELIRSECTRLKCFDKKNFFAHMGSASGTVLSGSGSNRVLRIKAADIQAALRSVVNLARGTKE